MPATRHARPRAEKRDELLAAAERLFVERGYESTTIAAVAADAGVASNVVYWYFESKDDLFITTLERMLDRVLREADAAARRSPRIGIGGVADLEAGLTSLVTRLLDARDLIAAVHERAAHSPSVGHFHDQVHARYTELLVGALRGRGVPAAQRTLTAEALITAIEGLVMHGATEAQSRTMVRFLLDRLAPSRPTKP
jgi:AcrR family transcriptional regulator